MILEVSIKSYDILINTCDSLKISADSIFSISSLLRLRVVVSYIVHKLRFRFFGV